VTSLLDGYRFEYETDSRAIPKQFGTDATTVDRDRVLEYLRTHTTDVDLDEVVARWRGDLVEYGLDELSASPRTRTITEVRGESSMLQRGDESDTFMPLAHMRWPTGVPSMGHTGFAGTDALRPRPTG
jgi:hypothetical protein